METISSNRNTNNIFPKSEFKMFRSKNQMMDYLIKYINVHGPKYTDELVNHLLGCDDGNRKVKRGFRLDIPSLSAKLRTHTAFINNGERPCKWDLKTEYKTGNKILSKDDIAPWLESHVLENGPQYAKDMENMFRENPHLSHKALDLNVYVINGHMSKIPGAVGVRDDDVGSVLWDIQR